MSKQAESASTAKLTWAEIERDSQKLAHRLRQKPRFNGIVAVTRGGLVPAALLSRLLEIRLVETLCISAYDDRTLTVPTLLKGCQGNGDGWLVVDDLVDTGATAQMVKSLLPLAHLATLYAKPQGLPWVDSFVTRFDQGCWITFPWEAMAMDDKITAHEVG